MIVVKFIEHYLDYYEMLCETPFKRELQNSFVSFI